jgi:hypothetical protein
MLCAALFAGTPFVVAGSAAPRIVRVYDMVSGAASRRVTAIDTAAAILDAAGVELEWVTCAPHVAADARCRGARGADDLVVRIIADGGPAANDGRFPLGYAVVDNERCVATLATVFADRVERIGRESRTDVALLLGRAIAHEVGHLVLRSAAHSRAGLMREAWTDAELYRNRADDWVFTPADRAGLRASIESPASVATGSPEPHSQTPPSTSR